MINWHIVYLIVLINILEHLLQQLPDKLASTFSALWITKYMGESKYLNQTFLTW